MTSQTFLSFFPFDRTALKDGPRPLAQAIALSVLAGLLLVLSFPNARWWPLAFIALVPFDFATSHQTWRRSLLLGAVLGFCLQAYLMFWVSFFGPPAFLSLALYRTYPYAFIGWGWAQLSHCRNSTVRLLGCACCWVFVEFYQTWGGLGATWGMLSHTLARHTTLIQMCSLAGPWLLSALVVASNLLVAASLRRESRRWIPLLCLAGLIGLSCAFGTWRLSQAPDLSQANPGTPSLGSIQVGAVQLNMGRDIKWNPAFAEIALARAEELCLSAAQAGSRLTIWPETSIPYRGFRKDLGLTQRIGELARLSGSNLVVGSIEMVGDAARHTLNTASLVGYQGGFEDRYDKQRLVPGGEFLPFDSVLRNFSIFDRVMRYLPGQGSGVMTCRFAEPPGQLRVGVLICFESMLPSLAVERTRAGAEALAVATNDGWFGDSSAITQHFEMAIFRAVETARPTIQAGNTGISGVIDAYGRVLSETAANEKAYVVGPLLPGHEITCYVRWGDWFAWATGLGWLCAALFWRSPGRREGPTGSFPKAAASA